jgi:hypothetical protein
VLKQGNRLRMLKINDRWSRVDGETPQLVVGNQWVADGLNAKILLRSIAPRVFVR